VFKVGLNDAAARRLEREAQQLTQLADSHVIRLVSDGRGVWHRDIKPDNLALRPAREAHRLSPGPFRLTCG
jgi:hypothetical protein